MSRPLAVIALVMAVLAVEARANTGAISIAIEKSEAIVVGYISTWTETDSNVSFDLTVDRVIAGVIPFTVIHVDHPWVRQAQRFNLGAGQGGTRAFVERLYGVWCLKRPAPSTWDILTRGGRGGDMGDLFWSASPTLPTAYQYSPSAPTEDKVTLEVAAGIAAAGQVPEALLNALGSSNTPAAQSVLSNFLNSPAPRFRAVGLAGLLGRNQPGSIASFVALWPSIRDDNYSRSFALSALRNDFRATDAASTQQLVILAETPSIDPDVRIAAVRAISSIHTKEALPFLASLLSSADAEEARRGVFGLSSFANGCPPQTPDNVKSMDYLQFKNPSPYRTQETMSAFLSPNDPSSQIAFWQQWWEQHPELH